MFQPITFQIRDTGVGATVEPGARSSLKNHVAARSLHVRPRHGDPRLPGRVQPRVT